jgi:hypothetical protein
MGLVPIPEKPNKLDYPEVCPVVVEEVVLERLSAAQML